MLARAASCFVANAENITRSHKTASPLVRIVLNKNHHRAQALYQGFQLGGAHGKQQAWEQVLTRERGVEKMALISRFLARFWQNLDPRLAIKKRTPRVAAHIIFLTNRNS